MLKSLNTAATGMAAQQANMDVISNNIANVNTVGFKKSRAEFEDLVYQTIREPGSASGANSQSPNGVQVGLGVRTAATQRDHADGGSVITKNPLDIQIEGSGFFQVLTPDGQIAYTRDGAFKKDSTGKIVDKNGNSLQPEITVPPNVVGLTIKGGGEIEATLDNNQITQMGQIDIATFVNPAGLRAVGKNLFLPSPSSGQPITVKPGQNGSGTLGQGQLETSNVNIADEMVSMIMAQRAYETNSKVMSTADQMLQSINNLK